MVSDDIPLLLPIGLLDQLRANLDLDRNQLTLRAIGVTTNMTKLPTGHRTIVLTDVAREAFLRAESDMTRPWGVRAEQFLRPASA